MSPMRTIPVIVAVHLLLAGAAQAQTPADALDVAKLGPQVGAAVPAFGLADQHGQTRSLESIVEPKGALIVFFRSASW